MNLSHGTPPREYSGYCVRCACEHRFENDVPLAHSAIELLLQQIESDSAFALIHSALEESRGKMVGVLIGEAIDGTRQVLRAYSGELAGRRDWPDWVGPVLRQEDTAELEAETLARIAALDEQIALCDVEGAQRRLNETRLAVRTAAAEQRELYRAERLGWRQAQRDDGDGEMLAVTVAAGKRRREESLAADAARVEAARQVLLTERGKLHSLREARREASRVLSTALFDKAAVTNARGERRPLREIFAGEGIAGGTTDCTVPKLLEAANVARLRPIALAEAWWGKSINGRQHGALQLPCERKCKPILGYLLCGLPCAH